MANIDIFAVTAGESNAKYFKWTAVGQQVQGTYTNVKEAVSMYGPQIVYTLKDNDGTFHNIAFRTTAKVTHDQMLKVKLGQIIGFKYEKDKPSKANPNINAKIVNLAQNANFVDEAWCAANKLTAGKTTAEILSGVNPSAPHAVYGAPGIVNTPYDADEPFPSTPVPVVDPSAPATLETCYTYLTAKGYVTPDMPKEMRDNLLKGLATVDTVSDANAGVILTNIKKMLG